MNFNVFVFVLVFEKIESICICIEIHFNVFDPMSGYKNTFKCHQNQFFTGYYGHNAKRTKCNIRHITSVTQNYVIIVSIHISVI